MASLCMVGLAVLLSSIGWPQIVIAGIRDVEVRDLKDWVGTANKNGSAVIKAWSYSQGRLSTEVGAGGASWFITPPLNLPKLSYLSIQASCNGSSACPLEISGSNDRSRFSTIQNVTFKIQDNANVTMNKPYRYLRILARGSTKSRFFISSIKMYRYVCEESMLYGAVLKLLNSSTTNVSVMADCQNHAVARDGKSTMKVICTPKGNWITGGEKCLCDKGFAFNELNCSLLKVKDASKIQCGSEGNSLNPIVMLFVGVAATLVIFLVVLIVIQVYKRRRKAFILSTPAHRIEMQNESLPKVSQNNQEVSHAIPRASGNGTQPYDDISTPPIPIYETADGDESSDDTYQIIQEIVLPYVSIIESDKEEIQGDVGVTNSAYAELDSMKREPNDDSNYQKLIKQS